MKKLFQLCIENIIDNEDEQIDYKYELITEYCKYMLNNYNRVKSWDKVLYKMIETNRYKDVTYFVKDIQYDYKFIEETLKLCIKKNKINYFALLIDKEHIIDEIDDNNSIINDLFDLSIQYGQKDVLTFLISKNPDYEIKITKETIINLFKNNYEEMIKYLYSEKYIKVEDFYKYIYIIVNVDFLEYIVKNILDLQLAFINYVYKGDNMFNLNIIYRFIELGVDLDEIEKFKDTNYENVDINDKEVKLFYKLFRDDRYTVQYHDKKVYDNFKQTFEKLKYKIKNKQITSTKEIKQKIIEYNFN